MSVKKSLFVFSALFLTGALGFVAWQKKIAEKPDATPLTQVVHSASSSAPTPQTEAQAISTVATTPLSKSTKKELLATKGIENERFAYPTMPKHLKLSKEQRIKEAVELEIERTKDPALGYVPAERRIAAYEATSRLQNEMMQSGNLLRGSLSRARWISRGASNIGGRTAALMIDLRDSTRKTLWVGHSSGGVWFTKDAYATSPKWERVNDYLLNLSVSSIAQNPVNPNEIYVGTGDVDANVVRGVGLLKSSDGGRTFNLLPNASGASFAFCSAIEILPTTGHILLGTRTGVYKSRDGGDTWEKVLGNVPPTLAGETVWKIERANDGVIYVAVSGAVYRSAGNGDRGTWTRVTGGDFPSVSRIEIAVAPSNSNVVYLVGQQGNVASAIYKTVDGGTTWANMGRVPWRDGCGGSASTTDFTRGQVWYDLSMAVSPTNPNMAYVGGIDLHRTANGGTVWSQMTTWTRGNCFPYVHADQHGFIFDKQNPSVAFVGCDGGIFRIDNALGTPSYADLNEGYITTQLYAAAINPRAGNPQVLAGAQDNGTFIVDRAGASQGRDVIGGDGFYCFIDENEPQYQIGSLYNGVWFVSTNEGVSFSSGQNLVSNGGFLTPADYDSRSNMLYAQTNSTGIWRVNIPSGNGTNITVNNGQFGNSVSFIGVDQNIANRIYIGTRTGGVYRVDNAHTGTTVDATLLRTFGSFISCVAVEHGNSNHIVVTSSSFGVNQVWESRDAGATWTSVEGNLPDMPVRWALFSPNNPEEVMLATDAGVWITEDLDGTNTVWQPPFPGRGIPVVRTDMLRLRKSDNVVLAATHGRGMWTTSVWSTPSVAMDYDKVGYLNSTVRFTGENSNAAETFLWSLGNGRTDTLENTTNTYTQIGEYDIRLTVNGNLTTNGKLKILPDRGVSYRNSTANWGGDFESTPLSNEQFGVWTLAGSGFERGKSTIFGKQGTRSGNNAFVIAPSSNRYAQNSHSILYTPNFNLSERTLYELSFWANYQFENGFDGFRMEYSTDRGQSWSVLGQYADNWYSTQNRVNTSAGFPIGSDYFSGFTDDWTKFTYNISFLAGQPNVAFRFVFRSGSITTSNSIGMALDDFEIIKFEGEPKTVILEQSATARIDRLNIDIRWNTTPEYFAQYFDVEYSTNGRDYEFFRRIPATGGTTMARQDYISTFVGREDIYYLRIKSVNQNAANPAYNYQFYTPIMVINRKGTGSGTNIEVNKVFPNPFVNTLGISFSGVVSGQVQYDLIDALGRVVNSQVRDVEGVYDQVTVGKVAAGVYFLRVSINGKESQTIRLYGGLN